MHHLNIVLFLGGVGFVELAILIVLLAVPGFFIWRAFLKYLVSKGSRGINIAAIIMGVFQSPVLTLFIFGLIYWIFAMREVNELRGEQRQRSIEEIQADMQDYTDSIASLRMVRLAKLVIDADKLEEYKAALSEEITTALNDEVGVLNLFAVFDKNDPTSLTILEIYADSASYAEHLKTKHFLKYKEETKDMVKSLELVEGEPLPGVEFY